jgi:hypothetical protein
LTGFDHSPIPFDDDHGITAAILELDAERIAAAR